MALKGGERKCNENLSDVSFSRERNSEREEGERRLLTCSSHSPLRERLTFCRRTANPRNYILQGF